VSGRILLVEDDEASRDMLSRRLARKGYAVKVVHDGAQALAAFGDATFDLVIMDMNLPVLDGYQATRSPRSP
jgi:two-component system response regulator